MSEQDAEPLPGNIDAWRLTTLVTSLAESVLIEDAERRVVMVNQAFCEAFGLPEPPAALAGEPCQAVALRCARPFKDPEGFLDFVGDMVRRGEPRSRTFVEMADGRLLEQDFVPIRRDDELMGYMWLYRDVTSQRDAEEHLAGTLELLEAIATAQLHYIQEAGADRVFGELLERGLAISRSEYGFIAEVVEHEGQPALRTRSITDISWDDDTRRFYAERAPAGLLFTKLDSLFGAVLTTKRAALCNDPANDPRAGGTPHGHPPLRAFLGLPFFHGGEMVGMMGLANREGGYDDRMVAYLEPFLTTCAGITYGLRAEAAQALATEELERARAAAEAANRSKSEFMAVASHELRTPLNAIIGMSELAIEADAAQRRELLAAVARNAHGLRYLLDEVLELAHAESSSLQLQLDRFSVNQLIKDVAHVHQGRAREKGLRLRALVDPELPAELLGDVVRLRQVLSNLVHNAVKFTDAGEVSLLAELVSQREGAVELRCTVRDTGVGMSEADRAQIFERFFQADRSSSRRHGGVGLGLSICRSLVALMGGRISARSVVGRGSEFTVDLSLPRPPQAPGVSAPRPALRPGLRVLLVEDNIDSQRYAELVLQAEGCEVDCAANGLQALAQRAGRSHDLLLVDLDMPELDGAGLAERIRAQERAEGRGRTPLIAVTAHAGGAARARCDAAGFDDHLAKPFRMAELIEIVSRWTAPPPEA